MLTGIGYERLGEGRVAPIELRAKRLQQHAEAQKRQAENSQMMEVKATNAPFGEIQVRLSQTADAYRFLPTNGTIQFQKKLQEVEKLYPIEIGLQN